MVTGAGGGIGRAIATRLAEDGFTLFLCDVDPESLETTAAIAGAFGGKSKTRVFDLLDEGAAKDAVLEPQRLDVLVNNAGVFDLRSMSDLSAQDFHRSFDVNALAGFYLARAAIQRMQDGGGHIVNIASRAYLGSVGFLHYVASKAAVVGMTRALALELAPRNILVNAVAPGVIDTAMLDAWGADSRARLVDQQPLGRNGTPEDVAHAVSFLVSDRNRFVTGQTLLVDGGQSIGRVPG